MHYRGVGMLRLTSFEYFVRSIVRLGSACIYEDAFKDSCCNLAYNFKSSLVPTLVKRVLSTSFDLHLHEHDHLVFFVHGIDRCCAAATPNGLHFKNIGDVLEEEIDLELFNLASIWDHHVECLVSVHQHFQFYSFFSQHINHVFVLHQKVNSEHFEDSLDCNSQIGNQFFDCLR